MSDMSGYSLDTYLNENSGGSTRAPLPFSNERQEYHNIAAIRGSAVPGGHLAEISQCYIIRFSSFTFCLHPPEGSTLDSLSSLISGLQQHAPIFTFGPNPGRWPAAQNASSGSNFGVLVPNRNPTSAPQRALFSGPTYISNPGVQLPVPSSVSGPRINQPVFNPSFVQYPIRQLYVPNSSFIPNHSVASNSNQTVLVNSSLPPPTYPSFLHNSVMPPAPNSYPVPNYIMQSPAPNPSHLHYQISNPTPVQPMPTIQSDIMSQSSNWRSPSSSYQRHVSNWQYMPYSGSVPQHHPGNLNLNGGPRNETVIFNPSPPQAANFQARNNYPPAPQPNYYNQGPGYLYPNEPNPTDSTVIITAQNSYPSEFIPNPSEQNSNPHLL